MTMLDSPKKLEKINPYIDEIYSLLKEIPKIGFSEKLITKRGRSFFRAQNIHANAMRLLHSLLIPDNPELCSTFDMKGAKADKMLDNTCDLFLNGDNMTSMVCASLLSQSYRQNTIKDSIDEHIDTMSVSQTQKINKHRLSFGNAKFRSSKELFIKLRLGQSVPKRAYSYRIKPEQIATSIQYLLTQLPVIAGMTRTAKIDGYSFRNLPVHSRGGKNILHLFTEYKNLHTDENTRVG